MQRSAFLFIGGFDSSALCSSRRELSNAYFLAKFPFDTAENEPSKVCQVKLDDPPLGRTNGAMVAGAASPGTAAPSAGVAGGAGGSAAAAAGSTWRCGDKYFSYRYTDIS